MPSCAASTSGTSTAAAATVQDSHQYAHTSDGVTASALHTVESLLKGGVLLIHGAKKALSEAREAQAPFSLVARKMPSPESVERVANGNTLLLALLRLDYLVAIGVVGVHSSKDIFSTILDHFVASHLRAEDARLAADAAKRALFRSKGKKEESNFESNEQKEEEAALRLSFPDHLASFKDILHDEHGPDGEGLWDNDGAEDEEGATSEEASLELAALDQELATKVTTRLVGLHARMVLLHSTRALSANGAVFVRTTTDVPVQAPGILPLSMRARLLAPLTAQSLVVAKSVDWSLEALVAPELEMQARSGTLSAIAAMAASTSSTQSAATLTQLGFQEDSPASSRWHAALARAYKKQLSTEGGSALKKKRVTNDSSSKDDADRDLLAILFYETHSGHSSNASSESWSPRNLHFDAFPEQTRRADLPLKNLLRRCIALLAVYPGNEILLTVSRLAQRITQLHVTTPLGKLLISLQVLSRKAQDWEQHAARHVSLAGEMQGIAALIKEWREIELDSWGDLLRCKEVEYVDIAMQQWYALSRVLRSVPEEL